MDLRDFQWRERKWMIYAIVRQLQPKAYGTAIQEEILQQHGLDLSAGKLYTYLDLLEQEGYLRHEQRRYPGRTRQANFYFATSKTPSTPMTRSRGRVMA